MKTSLRLFYGISEPLHAFTECQSSSIFNCADFETKRFPPSFVTMLINLLATLFLFCIYEHLTTNCFAAALLVTIVQVCPLMLTLDIS